MQYKCEVCHDSGSKNQTGDYLDCPACDMPHTRKALNDFVKSLGPTHPEDVALAIHQRALAMAPKQEAPEPVVQDCGACLGTGWVSRDADIGTEQECFSCDGSGKSEDVATAIATGALTEEQVVCALGCIANGRNAGYISTENSKVVREFIRAAPAAANGALTDEQILIIRDTSSHSEMERVRRMLSPGEANIAFARAILAAAGPDTTLVSLIHKAQIILGHHLPPDGPDAKTTISALLGLLDGPESRAALSGAKGN